MNDVHCNYLLCAVISRALTLQVNQWWKVALTGKYIYSNTASDLSVTELLVCQ